MTGDLELLLPGQVLIERFAAANIASELAWIVPPDILVGLERAYGHRVIHADVPAAMLAHVLPGWRYGDPSPTFIAG